MTWGHVLDVVIFTVGVFFGLFLAILVETESQRRHRQDGPVGAYRTELDYVCFTAGVVDERWGR